MDIFTDLYESIIIPFFEFIPKLIGALIIFIIGFFIIKAITKFVKKILEKSGIDKIKEMLDGIEMVDKSNLQIIPSIIISKFFYYTLLLFLGLIVASILEISEVSQLLQDVIRLIPNLLVALIILVIGILLADSLKGIVETACKSIGIPAGKIVAAFVFFFVFINALMISLQKATIPIDFLTDNLTVVLGGIVVAFAVGYGLASKDLMSNFLASIYSKDKLQVGDTITVDGSTGKIIALDSTSFTLLSDGKRVIIPLSKITNNKFEIHDN